MKVERVEDLRIFKLAFASAEGVSRLIEAIPRNWQVKEVWQIRSSSNSVVANIAEGFSRRFHWKVLVNFLAIALGSSDETQAHLSMLLMRGLISEEKAKFYKQEYKFLSIKILNFITYLRKRHSSPRLNHHRPTIEPQ